MQSLMALLLVPFMALLIGIQKSSGASAVPPKKLFSKEGKKTMNELQKYVSNVDKEFDEFADQLMQENNALDALQEYKQLLESSKDTGCKGNDLPVEEDEDLLESFIKECSNTLPLDKLSAFHSKIAIAMARVEAIDEQLQNNEPLCDKNPNFCEDNKEKYLQDLNRVLSAEAKAEFENDAHQVLADAKQHLEKCFTEESDDLLDDLQTSTNALTDCLSKLSE